MSELQTLLNNIINNKTNNLKPENLKHGVTCLGVTGTLEEGIKQFISVEEMNQSTGNKNGDKAIVYSQAIIPITEQIPFDNLIFPHTCVITNTLTDMYSCIFDSKDHMANVRVECQLGYKIINIEVMAGWVTGIIEYSIGDDEKTLTLSSQTGLIDNKIEFKPAVQFTDAMGQPFAPWISELLKTNHIEYEGLYEYNDGEWVLKGKPVKNQEKVITDNGTYTPDAEHTGFDKVTVNVPKGVDTSDATALADDIINPKTAYVNNRKITGTIEKIENDISSPTLLSTVVRNSTDYKVLDINYEKSVILMKVSDTRVRVYKISSNGNLESSKYIDIDTSSVVTIGNQNMLLDSRFLYTDTNEIGIAFVIFTNYKGSTWTNTYKGAIQYINIESLELGNLYQTSIDFPADGRRNDGIILPRPADSNSFIYYGYFSTNGDQHCLFTYNLDTSLHCTNIFTTNYENHGVQRFGNWTDDGKLLYISDLTNLSQIYEVSPDGKKYTIVYNDISNLVPLSSNLGIKDSNQLISLPKGNLIKTLDINIDHLKSNWITHRNYLFINFSTYLDMYKIDLDFQKLDTFNSLNQLPIKSDLLFIPVDTISFNIIDTVNIQREVVSLKYKNTSYIKTSDATATASDIKSGSTAYAKDTKLTGTLTFDKFDPDYTNCLSKASQIEGSIPLENPYFVKSLTNQDIEPDKYKSNIRTWITEIPKLDTSNVTNMHYMFANCTNLTTIPVLDTSKVTDMGYMFTECSSLTEIPLIDTSKVTSMTYMFSECSSLTTIPLLNTSNVTNMERMFFRSNLTSIPLIDTSNVTNMTYMFYDSDLTTIPQLDTSNVTNMTYMFANCTKLTTIPLLNTSNVTNMYGMFNYCTHLTTIPLLNTSNVTNMEKMFQHCFGLTAIPLLDTSKVTNMYAMFDYCTDLTTIPVLDTSKVTSMTYMFSGCTKLSDESLNNILQMCINAVSYTKTKTLDNIGLSREQVARCESLSNWQAFLDAGWAA